MSDIYHYGVKGMKWGVRKDKPSESRKDYRSRVKKERREFNNQKLDRIVKESLDKNSQVLISTRMQGDVATTIMTGRELVRHLSRGGTLDIRSTEVYARRGSEGPFVINENPIGNYRKSDRK